MGKEFNYEVFPYSDIDLVKQKLKKMTGTYICWKMVNVTATLVEKSQFFENILSIFVTIGHQALLTEHKVTNMNTLSKYVKTN